MLSSQEHLGQNEAIVVKRYSDAEMSKRLMQDVVAMARALHEEAMEVINVASI